MKQMTFVSHLMNIFGRAHHFHQYQQQAAPARWWLTDDDWDRLRCDIDQMMLRALDMMTFRFAGLPVTIDRSGQRSRLILEDGTAIAIEQTA